MRSVREGRDLRPVESDDGVGRLNPEAFDVEEEGRVRFKGGRGQGGERGRVRMMGEEKGLVAASEADEVKAKGKRRGQLDERKAKLV